MTFGLFFLLVGILAVVIGLFTCAYELSKAGDDRFLVFVILGVLTGLAFVGMFNKIIDKVL